MLVSGGKILALSKVEKDETLVGLGTPDSPLGIKNPEQYAQKEWVEETFVSGDYLEKNYWTSAATSAAVEARIRQISGATEYSAGNGIKVENYIISLQESAFNPVKSWVEEQQYLQEEDLGPYATKEFVTSADGIIKTWIENNYWTSSATSAEIARQLADFGGFEPVSTLPTSGDPKKIYLIKDTTAPQPDQYKEYIWNNNNWLCIGDTSMDLTPYAKTDWVSGELDKKVNTADFNSYKTEVEHALADKLDKDEFDTYSAGIATALGSKLDKDDFEAWSAHAFDDYAKTDDVDAKFSAASAWANNAFQPKGNYVTDEEFGTYQSEVEQEFANTSAWAENTFVSANEFNEYKNTVADALEGKLDKSDFDTYSAGIDDDLGNISADLVKKLYTSATENWDVQKYTQGKDIKIENHVISVDADYVTSGDLADALDNYYTKAETWSSAAISNEFSSTSAWANDKFQPKGDYLTTDEANERYLPLSANLHNVVVTSQDESVTVNPTSADGIVTYDLHVDPPAAEVKISGENGVSAQYNEATSAWLVGLEHANSATYMGTQSTITRLTADATQENPETLSGFGINTQIYGTDITVTTDTVTLEKGMYHVDLQIDVTVPGGDPSYYTTTIKPTLSNSVLTHVVDGSYDHTETLDLSFIVDVAQATSSSALQFELEGLPAGASYVVKNLQVCEIVTVDSELHSQGGTYTGGNAIAIDAQNKINVKYNSASGIGLDENGQLMVKLGKGLTFDTSGAAAGTLMLDNVTEEVVETVTALKAELDSKLTVNFNYPQITDNNYDFGTLKSGDTCICQLFAVSLQHEIIENKTVFSVYVKDTGYSQANVILGIFEYDFDGNDGSGTTNWVCDTGPVSLGKQTTHDKLEFPVTHVNPDRHVLRSDRAYYAVLAMKSDGGNGIFLASCPGYSPNVNSNPTLNWRYANAVGLDFVNPSGSLANTHWWESGYNEKNDMNRFFLQIRNKAEV